jgi:hypothetical protein
MVSALVLLIAAQQSAPQAPAWVGKWEGHYTLENDQRDYQITLDISSRHTQGKGYEVQLTYDHTKANGNNWQRGEGHGFIEDDCDFKWLYRFPGQPKSWGQHEGRLIFNAEKQTFSDEAATLSTPSPNDDERNPKSSKVFLSRPSG